MLRQTSVLNIKNLDAKPALSHNAVLFEFWVAGIIICKNEGSPLT